MIGLKKKQPFSLKDALHTDIGLRVAHASGTPEWQARVEGLQALGVRSAVVVTDPLALSLKKRTKTVYEPIELSSTAGFSVEVLPSYWLNEGLEMYVQQQPLIAYRNKYVMLALHEKTAVRELKGPIFELRARGYEPIILHREPRKFAKLKVPALEYLGDLGCLLQLDLMVLTGAYGQPAKAQAEALLTSGLIYVLTTGIRTILDAEKLARVAISTNVITTLEQAIEQHKLWLTESSSNF